MFYVTKEVLYFTGHMGVILHMARQNYIYNSRGGLEKRMWVLVWACVVSLDGVLGMWRSMNYLYNCGVGT
jgi:hypothetical protein